MDKMVSSRLSLVKFQNTKQQGKTLQASETERESKILVSPQCFKLLSVLLAKLMLGDNEVRLSKL